MKLETIIAARIKEGRQSADMTLQALGVAVGIEEETAKTRMHQYENGVHHPPMSMLERIATVLHKPTEWFICSEEMKEIVLEIYLLPSEQRKTLLLEIKSLLNKE
jgi:transcriptional regulator with XRE-family HTH domain